jgi:hypothetical protein
MRDHVRLRAGELAADDPKDMYALATYSSFGCRWSDDRKNNIMSKLDHSDPVIHRVNQQQNGLPAHRRSDPITGEQASIASLTRAVEGRPLRPSCNDPSHDNAGPTQEHGGTRD